jgi:hypothetical protein
MTGSNLAAGHPTDEEIRAEAVFRVDARHRGCIPPSPEALADEYDRAVLRVASLARQFPWASIERKPPKQ